MNLPNPTNHPSTNNYEPIPPGEYDASIERAEIKDTKAGTGSYIEVEFLFTSPPVEGRKAWGRYTMTNPNDEAVRIGLEQLSELMLAVGLTGDGHQPDDLLQKQCKLNMGIKTRKDNGEKESYIRYAKPLVGQSKPTAKAAMPNAQVKKDDYADVPF